MARRFCPNCGSREVEPDSRHTNVLGEAIFNQNKWLCNECGYTGVMPEGDPDEVEEGIEFEPEDQPTVDTDAGKAYASYMKILVPVILLAVAVFILVY